MTVKTIRATIAAAALAIAALAGTVAATQADAQVLQCGPRSDMVKALGSKFQETRRGLGLISSKRMLELYASPQGNWTILFTTPSGISCIGAAGSHWQTQAPSTGTSYTAGH